MSHSTKTICYGFSLIELSIVLVIIALIIGGGLNLLVVSTHAAQYNATVATMDIIEDALLHYVAVNGRIPCPADLTITQASANYGLEAGATSGGVGTGECVTGMTPAANFTSASGVEEGGVPTAALRLPDSYMYDGWGHKIRYVVDPNQTISSTTQANWPLPRGCVPSGGTPKPITINDASGSPRTTAAVYALISHGANGHGAYTSSGVPFNAGSLNTDELTNCHCDNTGAHTGGAGVLSSPTYVQKAPAYQTGQANQPLYYFDDIVTYKEAWQMQTPHNQITSSCPASYYRSITIDHTKVPNTDQTNFSVLFSGTYSYLATTANGGLVQNANGYDITFTADSAGQNLLPFEIESYNATTGQITAWIQIPTVSHSSNTTIYLQYGNAGITTDQSNKTRVWNNNYVLVQHLAETSGTTTNDSTGNGNTGIKLSSSTPSPASGLFGGAQSFASNGYITIPASSALNFTTSQSYTISAWVYLPSIPGGWAAVAEVSRDSMPWYGLWTDASGNWAYGTYAGQTQNLHGTPAATGWHYMVGTQQASVQRTLYIDGTSNVTLSGSVDANGGSYMQIGADHHDGSYSEYITATIAEVRVSNTNRSADWTATEYNNQGWPDKASTGLPGMSSGFYTVGAQQGSR